MPQAITTLTIGNVLYRTNPPNCLLCPHLTGVFVAKILPMPKRTKQDLEKAANAPVFFSSNSQEAEEEQAFNAKVDSWLEIAGRLLSDKKPKKVA